MEYAKLVNGELEFAPTNKGSICNYNLAIDLILEDGYKQVIRSELPKDEDRPYNLIYSETDDKIFENIEYLESEEQYQERLKNQEIENSILELKFKIDVLDTKRIRAICEPEVMDEKTGETWLEYYNSQIIALRLQKQELEERLKNDKIK